MFFKIVPFSVCIPLLFGLFLLFLLPFVFRVVKRVFFVFFTPSFKARSSAGFSSVTRSRLPRFRDAFRKSNNRFSKGV